MNISLFFHTKHTSILFYWIPKPILPDFTGKRMTQSSHGILHSNICISRLVYHIERSHYFRSTQTQTSFFPFHFLRLLLNRLKRWQTEVISDWRLISQNSIIPVERRFSHTYIYLTNSMEQYPNMNHFLLFHIKHLDNMFNPIGCGKKILQNKWLSWCKCTSSVGFEEIAEVFLFQTYFQCFLYILFSKM